MLISNKKYLLLNILYHYIVFKIKSTTGKNASEETASETAPQPETEPQASENVDLSPQEDQQQSPSEVQENNPTEETQPSIKREDDGDDKIKFKR